MNYWLVKSRTVELVVDHRSSRAAKGEAWTAWRISPRAKNS